MTDDLAAGVGQEQAFNDPEFLASVRLHEICRELVWVTAQKLQQFFVTALTNCLTQPGHLLHGLW